MNLPDKEELYGGKITLEKELYIDVKNYIREKKGLYYVEKQTQKRKRISQASGDDLVVENGFL